MIRAPPKTTLKFTTRATVRTTIRTTVRTTVKTTQKRPGTSINNVANVLTDGINAVGQISNALGNLHCKNKKVLN
jgi:hypothetical protein